ncbi:MULTISPECIES: Rv3235 family protein [unclassified Isoptericola]|uniref:Rv3235 family protein n=1 Tax=unclassified Isoptericola TaxID=2623355 RepID=UPI002712DD29|nr:MULTISPECIES: Rv3235 family protein [unclassified Isoptericola]MDO8144173.1 Rv3235 family protein [Isoptericola sp. 178]MDO8148027.1 Rv3235 family protein [Isoptericola sp. b515]MDO8151503.1 Rv3235 family protein [Isoptericola sp. b408]
MTLPRITSGPADPQDDTSARRLRVAATPGARPPARPPQAPARRAPVRRVRVGRDAPVTPVPGRPLAEASSGQVDGPHPSDPTALCCSVVRAAVEVLRGERPAAQVARWVTPQVHDQLAHRARLLRAAATARPARPVTVRRVRTVRLGPGTAEATVVLEDSGRVRAAAARLEVHRGTWRVTVLELG